DPPPWGRGPICLFEISTSCSDRKSVALIGGNSTARCGRRGGRAKPSPRRIHRRADAGIPGLRHNRWNERLPECRELARAPDLAVIARPSDTVPALIGQLGERGTRAAVVISAGFGELGEQRRCAAASGIGRG